MKKVLFLIDSLQGGGAERALINLVNKLDVNRYDITVQTLYNEGVYIKDLPKYVKYKSASLVGVRGINYLFKFCPPSLLHKIFIKEKYDMEIAFLEGITTKIISGGKSKIKKIAWVRIDVAQHKRAEVCYFSKNQIIKCYKKFNKIAFVGYDSLNSFRDTYGIDINLCVVRNIFEYSDMIKRAEEICDLTQYQKPIFVSVGRLEEQKGYDRLIEVHKNLIDKGLTHSIIILGKGSQEEKLKNKIAKYNLQNSFYLLGFNENPFKYIKRADWFLSSSYFEGFSSVIREAVLLETPIIATDCSGVKEVLGENSEYGILVQNSMEGIYKGMKRAISNVQLREFYTEQIKKRKMIFDYDETIKLNRLFIQETLEGEK